jgi:hypothetical protein
MAYATELYPGQRFYLHNDGTQTVVTLSSTGAGQQQQASTSLATGAWSAPPVVYRTEQGAVVKITTAEGDRYFAIVGNSIQTLQTPPSVSSGQQIELQQTSSPNVPSMQPMQPMQPMRPMNMGGMSMNMNPMEMRMGDMTLSANSPSQSSSQASAQSSAAPTNARRFCTQCGNSVDPSDRFCAHCGQSLKP